MPFKQPEDLSHYFHSTIPNASFTKITLEVGGPPSLAQLKDVWAEDPHVAPLQKSPSAFASSLSQQKYKYFNQAGDSKELNIKVQLEMKTVIPKAGDIYSNFLFGEDFAKYFKAIVFQNKNPDLYDVVTNAIQAPRGPGSGFLAPLYYMPGVEITGQDFASTGATGEETTSGYKASFGSQFFEATSLPGTPGAGQEHDISKMAKMDEESLVWAGGGGNVLRTAFDITEAAPDMPQYSQGDIIKLKSAESLKDLADVRVVSPASTMPTTKQGVAELVNGINKTVDGAGNTIINIPFTVEFKAENVKPEHLSYFVMTFLDVEQINKDYGEFSDDFQLTGWTSRIIPFGVIKNGQIEPTYKRYKLPNGKIWAGPVHKMEESDQYMTQPYHVSPNSTEEDNPFNLPASQNLLVEFVENNVVQDFRIIKEELDYNLTNATKKAFDEFVGSGVTLALNPAADDQFKLLTNDNIGELENKSSYFSNLFVSRDNFGGKNFAVKEVVRLFFSVDMLGLFKDTGVYSNLLLNDLDTDDPQVLNDIVRPIVDAAQILSIKLFRKRIKFVPGVNKIGIPVQTVEDFDINEPPDLIGIIEPNGPEGNFRELRGDFGQFKGGGRQSAPYMRHFTATDYIGAKPAAQASKEVSDGLYQYYVEIKFIDSTITHMRQLYNDIMGNYTLVEDYYLRSLGMSKKTNSKGKPNYNSLTNEFSGDFLEEMIGDQNLNMFANNDKLKDFVLNYIAKVSLFTKTPLSTGKAFSVFFSLLSPFTATPQGIKKVLKQMEDLLYNLRNIMDAVAGGQIDPTPVSSNTGQTGGVLSSYVDKRAIEVRNDFNQPEEIIDADVPKMFGYDFLRGGGKLNRTTTLGHKPNDASLDDKTVGLVRISSTAYKDRTDAELGKYFKTSSPSSVPIYTIDPAGPPKKQMVSIESSKRAYLTPSRAYIGHDEAPINFTSIGQGSMVVPFFVSEWYQRVLLTALRYNASLDIAKEPFGLDTRPYVPGKIPITEQKIRNGLLDLFANGHRSDLTHINCTISSMKAFQYRPVRKKTADEIALSPSGQEDLSDLETYGLFKTEGIDSISESTKRPDKVLQHFLNIFTTPLGFSDLQNRDYNLNTTDYIGENSLLNAPPQMVALISFVTNFYTRMVGDVAIDHIDKISPSSIVDTNPEKNTFGFFYHNFFNINKVEVFSGYHSLDGVPQMKHPVYHPMTGNQILSFESVAPHPTDLMLCRQMPYNDARFEIKDYPHLDLPLYNQYFFMSNDITEVTTLSQLLEQQ